MDAVPVGSRLRAIVMTAVSAIDIQASSRSRLDFLLLDLGLSSFIIALRYLDESITASGFESGFSNKD